MLKHIEVHEKPGKDEKISVNHRLKISNHHGGISLQIL